MLTPASLVALLIAVLICALASWYFGKKLGEIKSYQLLDRSLLVVVAFLLLARILGLIFYAQQNIGVGWSLLPVDQVEEGLVFFSQWPWIFFRFTDGQFLFLEAASAYVIADIILSFVQRHSENRKTVSLYYQLSFLISMLAVLPLAVSSYLNGYLSGFLQFPVPVFIFVVQLAAIVLGFFLGRTRGLIYLLIIVLQIATIVSLATFSNYSEELNTSAVGFMYIVFLAFTIVRFIYITARQKKEADIQRERNLEKVEDKINYRVSRY